MIEANLLPILRCPIDGNSLEIADPSLVQQVNGAIGRGELRDRQDQRVTEPITAGLVGGQGGWVYPIRNSIPTLIADEAIMLRG